MQEFTIKYEGMHQGLRPASKGRRENPALIEAHNLRTFRKALRSIQPIIAPVSVDAEFPFPQLYVGQKIYRLEENAVKILSSQFETLETLNCAAGYSWHVADFGLMVLFTNGEVVVEDHPDYGLHLWSGPDFATCCAFKGQIFAGGFLTPWNDAEFGSVGWSKIGSSEFVLDKSNVSGYAHLSKGDSCLRVMKLGEGVVAYGNQGVDFFQPVAEPFVTFAKRFLDAVPGVAGRSAVGGNEQQHVLVDSVGQLWAIGADLQPKLLGYQEFFAPMLGEDIVVTFNAAEGSFSIASSIASYLLSDGGLTRQYQAITSQQVYLGGSIGFFEEVDDQGFELKTDTLDMGYRGLKTLTSLEVGHSSEQPVYASVDWRSHTNEPFRSHRWVRLNERGIATLMVTAAEFRLKLQSASFENVEVDYILVKFKASDKRNVRGANPDAS